MDEKHPEGYELETNYYVGKNCVIFNGAIVGLKYHESAGPARFGSDCVIRAGTIIYGDVSARDHFQTGHNALIREKTYFGSFVVVGTQAILEGHIEVGSYVKIESQVFIPTHTKIGSYVFLGPGAILTNDRYPQRLRDQYQPKGPILEDGVSVGAGAIILPGVRIGEGSFIGAGTVVTKDTPPMSLVFGTQGNVYPLPKRLRERNTAIKW